MLVVPVYEFSSPLLIFRAMVTVKGVNDVPVEVNVTLDWSAAIDVVTEGVNGLKVMKG